MFDLARTRPIGSTDESDNKEDELSHPAALTPEMISLAGIEIELFEGGNGSPLLFLHGALGFMPEQPYVGLLAQRRRLIAPSHPGFGASGLPLWLDSIDDIAHLYLELLDSRGLDRVDIVGCSLGGWLAAEIATKTPERIGRLALVGPVGVKLGPSDKLDIPDIFAMPQEKVEQLVFHDVAKGRLDVAKLSDEQLTTIARNRETTALLTWEPWMHNPKLRYRLHRIAAPTLFIRGASDGLVSQSYIDGYAKLISNARVATIAAAGHAPQLEQPEEFARTLFAFLEA